MRIARIFNANVKVWQLVAALVVTSFAVAGLATANGNGNTLPPASTPAAPLVDQVITACAHKNSGNLRVLWGQQGAGKKSRAAHHGSRKGQCRKSERMLRWNAQGPSGATGQTGPTGDSGPTGPTGPTA